MYFWLMSGRSTANFTVATIFAFPGMSLMAADDPSETSPLLDCTWYPSKLETRHLPNAVQVAPTVISGGLPEGDAGFAELEKLGVKTVISVDGMQPDIAGAKKHGLRYVHLPHGYDGISESRVEELAKAVRVLPGPIYIHCHHGKHRSPAAAVAACVTAGLLDAKSADDILNLARTGKNYTGLVRDAKNARQADSATLDALDADFPEVAKLPPMAEAMVEIDESFDRLKKIAAAGWRAPADHPDLDPAHEALILREQFTELLRTDDVQQRPTKFRALLQRSKALSERLESVVRGSGSETSRTSARVTFDELARNCAACHTSYRDTPQREKR